MALTPDRERYYVTKLSGLTATFLEGTQSLADISSIPPEVITGPPEELDKALTGGDPTLLAKRDQFFADMSAIQAEMDAEGAGSEFERIALIATGKAKPNYEPR